MSNQNKPYEIDNGMNIRIKDFSDGTGTKIDFYSTNPQDDHTSIHMKIDYDSKSLDIIDTTSGEKEESKSNCFLTTAFIKHMGINFDDKCYELTILRWFRDNFVTDEDIKYYYTFAPIIVEEIDKLENCDEIYKNIYDNVIVFCIKYIENKDYKRTYDLYKKCILDLEEKYVSPVLNQRLIEVLRKKRDLMYARESLNLSFDQENIDYIRKSVNENDGMSEKVYRMIFSSKGGNVNINEESRKICAESLLK